MSAASSLLIVQCRLALALTQEELANVVGCTKRTIQRWEDRGATLVGKEIEALARALHAVRPDLAAQIASIGDTTLEALGIAPQAVVSPVTTLDPIDAVVRAAADAMGVTPDAIRPALAAAFTRAREIGLDLHSLENRLRKTD